MDEGPVRSCVGCRAKRPQQELIRVVRRAGGSPAVEPSGRARDPGRGAYVCFDPRCVEAALAGGLKRALRYEGNMPEALRAELMARVEELRQEGN